MATSVSDFIIDRLIAWDLHHWYGYPGDGIGGFDGAMGRAQDEGKDFTYVRPTHEEEAAFMATAHAKFTGEVGVCVSTSGPGAIHLMNGLYDAKGDNAPVVAIVGQQARVSLGSEFQQEINLERLFADAAVFVQTVAAPMHAQLVVDKAVRMAKANRGPAVVVLPADVQTMDMEELAVEHFVSRTGIGYAEDRLRPDDDALARAAEVLNSGEKVAMLVGQGAIGATDEVMAVAKRLGAGVITTLLGKQVVPGDVDFHTQQLGLLGSRPSYDMMQKCDTLLMVGTNYPYGEFMPPTGRARAVQIDLSPRHLGIRYPTEVNLWGDAKTTLAALQSHLSQHETGWQEKIADENRAWMKENTLVAMTEADPINPRRVFVSLNERLPENAIITCDAGSTADWYGFHVELGPNQMGNLSGRMASMLAAMPYALAGKFAHPDRPVVCTIGDGAFQMMGMNGLLTVKRHWREWSNSTFVVLVIDNGDLNQVSWEMREAGDPRWDTAQLVESMDYAGYAELLGLKGIRVDDPEKIDGSLDEAFAADRPVVLDVRCDRNTPPLPAHIAFAQAKGLAESLLAGDPELGQVVKQSSRATAARLFARMGLTSDD
ncbi:thiamine pyrophosphate-requiring protein [Brevibacterium sediminis]|uniref:Thiamine pyrophosphate-requiring protein n=1 Tax=Brevibacterium sediminis TaxID=1857024 RepID=A0A5C4X2B4_9MICO|nr:thiamine pyrophosphate-requiring protein [Brevibacterium sediminis]TNM55211.1 thiamine pyrophosphate-requiring protein [Brevibacterium sediminis]